MKDWKLGKTGDTPLEIYTKMLRSDERKERRWRILAVVSFAFLLISLGTLIWAARLPKTVPLIISVSDWGEAKYMGAASNYSYTGMKVPQKCIEYQLKRLVKNIYSLSSDFNILRTNINDCYYCLTPECGSKLTAKLRQADPRSDFGSHLRTVSFESILQLSQSSYQVDFIVIDTNMAGRTNYKMRMRGVMSVQLMEPSDESINDNPLGIYITNFDFTELGEAK